MDGLSANFKEIDELEKYGNYLVSCHACFIATPIAIGVAT